jgi:hypothetical protein
MQRPGVIDPKNRERIRIQAGVDSPGSVLGSARTAEPEDLVGFPCIGVHQGHSANPERPYKISGLPGTVHEAWSQLNHKLNDYE